MATGQEPFHHPPIRDGWEETGPGAWTLFAEDDSAELGYVYREDAGDFVAVMRDRPTQYFDTLDEAMRAVERGLKPVAFDRQAEFDALQDAEDANRLSPDLEERVRKERGFRGFERVFDQKVEENRAARIPRFGDLAPVGIGYWAGLVFIAWLLWEMTFANWF